jgi:hypothetical protein
MMLRIKQVKIGTYEILAVLIIAFATFVRLFLTARGWPHSNADEDTMGIMAIHIAYRGDHPIFFYGQYYMGTLEAYLGALFFRLFGISVFALRLGPVLFFALFLANIYLLTSLLYTKKLAIITLVLLSLGSSIMLDTELVALGGYPELLFFGSLSLLIASWLALTSDQYASPRQRLWRVMAYACWGLVGGLGFWSDFLMLGFIVVSGFLLVMYCWRELLKGAVLPLVSGLVIGAFPLIVYNLHAPPGQNTLAVLKYLHTNGSIQLAQLSAHDPIPFGPQLRGALLTSLPATTGEGTPFCFEAYTHFRLTGYLGTEPFPCSIVHSNWSIVGAALVWSLGFILLWISATFLTLKHLSKLRSSSAGQWRQTIDKQAVRRDFARLMLLGSAALTCYLFVSSPISAAFPANSRYLIGLLIATPALIAPLWGLAHDKQVLILDLRTKNTLPTTAFFPFSVYRTSIKVLLRRGLLLLIGIIFFVGTVRAFLEIPTVQIYNHQQDALIHDLTRMKITHFYTDYWTCDSIAFLSKEQVVCSSVDDALRPHYNRYLPYVAIVKADPHSAYVFPLGASQIPSIAKKAALSAGHYQRFVLDGYVIYKPLQTTTTIPAG